MVLGLLLRQHSPWQPRDDGACDGRPGTPVRVGHDIRRALGFVGLVDPDLAIPTLRLLVLRVGLELRPERRIADHADHRVHLLPDVVGARHDVRVLSRDAGGLGGGHITVPLDRPRLGKPGVVHREPPLLLGASVRPRVDVVELGLVVPALPVRPEAHVRLDRVDLASVEWLDADRVLPQVQHPLGPATTRGRLAVAEVRDGARLRPDERPEAQDVALGPAQDLEVQRVDIGEPLAVGGVMHGRLHDRLPDQHVRARVLPLLQDVQVQRAHDEDELDVLGRLVLVGRHRGLRAVHPEMVRGDLGRLGVGLPVRGRDAVVGLLAHRRGVLGAQALGQLLRAMVLERHVLQQAPQQALERLLGRLRGVQELGHPLLHAGHDPRHGGLDLAHLLLRLGRLAHVPVVRHGHQGVRGLPQ